MNKCRHCNGTGRVNGLDHEGNDHESNCLYCEGTGVAGVGNGLKPKSQENYWKEECRRLQDEVRRLRMAGSDKPLDIIASLTREKELLEKGYLALEGTILELQKELAVDETIINWVLDSLHSNIGEADRKKMENRLIELRPLLLQARSRKSDILTRIQNDLINRLPIDVSSEISKYFTYNA